LLDEIGDAEYNAEYALLWELAVRTQRRRPFSLLITSATISDQLLLALTSYQVNVIRCCKSPFDLTVMQITVSGATELYVTMARVAQRLLERGQTSLLFLPGKKEIELVQDHLKHGTVPEESMSILHADIDADVLHQRLQSAAHARVMLSTNIAQKSVTIPGVDFVLNSGFTRTSTTYTDIVTLADHQQSQGQEIQRHGRAGRVKPGAAIEFTWSGRVKYGKPACNHETLLHAIAITRIQDAVNIRDCNLLRVTREEIECTEAELTSYNFTQPQLRHALNCCKLSLRDAKVLTLACDWQVGYEAAAILAFKETAHCSAKVADISVSEVLACIAEERNIGKSLGRLKQARDHFQEIVFNLHLQKSTWPQEHMLEALAVSFLSCPERLIWNIRGQGSFLGESLINSSRDEYFVAAAITRGFKGLVCQITLPWTPWVKEQSGIQEPFLVMSQIGDSTFADFRLTCVLAARTQRYDIRFWRSEGGAWEDAVVRAIASSIKSDLTIACPNGNKIHLERKSGHIPWLENHCMELAGALQLTSTRAILFVGDPMLSPGVRHPAAYELLINLYQST
jgi:hypothetical protein